MIGGYPASSYDSVLYLNSVVLVEGYTCRKKYRLLDPVITLRNILIRSIGGSYSTGGSGTSLWYWEIDIYSPWRMYSRASCDRKSPAKNGFDRISVFGACAIPAMKMKGIRGRTSRWKVSCFPRRSLVDFLGSSCDVRTCFPSVLTDAWLSFLLLMRTIGRYHLSNSDVDEKRVSRCSRWRRRFTRLPSRGTGSISIIRLYPSPADDLYYKEKSTTSKYVQLYSYMPRENEVPWVVQKALATNKYNISRSPK